MKVTLQVINGRTYVDVVDLIRAIEQKSGNQIVTKDLVNRLWDLDEQGQKSKGT